ncbi:MAG TPA: hypothetical protein GXX48_20615 [Ochrobactrum intermedium]|uniref:Uncharacterized protein n=1 Tax=Brucella intermedia TaxID=94625 RepID=A0A7V6U1N8_9HYPH|nr:hypothetical protein [Brucella intermedia]HHV70012.1 hypothetical protein [Brucella intermedia]
MTAKGSISIDHLEINEHFVMSDYEPYHDYEPGDDFSDELDTGDACGRWTNGKLGEHCTLAGTEFCDWQCPHNRSAINE